MKKRLIFALLAVVVLSMTGCGSNEGEVKETDIVTEEVVGAENQTTGEIEVVEDSEAKNEEDVEVTEDTEEQTENVSAIVLEEGQPDETATAVMYYIFEKEITDENGDVVGSVSFQIPQITLRSMSAGMINQDILTYFEDILAYAEDMDFISADEWDSEAPQLETTVAYNLTYISEDIVCFLMDGYEYTGGAHGMPFREVMIYDLISGERVYAEDVLDVDEATFSKAYMDAYEAKIAESPDLYWEEAVEILEGEASFDNASYYLSDTGVIFYQEPYMIAPYSEGYVEVEVSYETLPLKITE